jgi:hypothetical protein
VGVWKAQSRLMMVDLPEPDEPTSAVTVPGFGLEAHTVQHRIVLLVLEDHILEFDIVPVHIESIATVRAWAAEFLPRSRS